MIRSSAASSEDRGGKAGKQTKATARVVRCKGFILTIRSSAASRPHRASREDSGWRVQPLYNGLIGALEMDNFRRCKIEEG